MKPGTPPEPACEPIVDELRRRLVVLPSLTVVERLCAEVATRAERRIFALLTADLTARQRMELDRLLELRERSPYGILAWLRLPPGAPTAKAIFAHIERLRAIEGTLFMLEWLQNPEVRGRVNTGLNKNEAKNALARAVFFNRLGELRDRSFENQRYRASGLNLAIAAIITWNTAYLERALASLTKQKTEIQPELLAHISPLGWEHIGLTGDYSWHENKRVAQGHFRPPLKHVCGVSAGERPTRQLASLAHGGREQWRARFLL